MELMIIYMVAALLISGLCSVLEATLMSTPMSYISSLEAQGLKGAALLKKYKLDIERPISAILVLNTIANTVGASLVGSEAMQMAQAMHYPHDTVVGIVSGVFTLLILICSEIIPKTIGSTHWRKLAIPASKIIRVLVVVTFPLVWCLERITHLMPDTPTVFPSPSPTADTFSFADMCVRSSAAFRWTTRPSTSRRLQTPNPAMS